MKAVIVFFLLSVTCFAFSQTPDTVTVQHIYYSSTFSKSLHFPVVVKYWLTKKMLSCKTRVKRSNDFRPDPQLPEYTDLKRDYAKSGYDRGHNMDAFDNGCDKVGMHESFYYSNMSPQTPALNRGPWKSLEEYVRSKAIADDSVLVWCGSVSLSSKHIGKVAVPDYCWKLIFFKKLGVTEAYSFKNNSSPSKSLGSYKVSADSIWHLSGFKLSVN